MTDGQASLFPHAPAAARTPESVVTFLAGFVTQVVYGQAPTAAERRDGRLLAERVAAIVYEAKAAAR